MTDPCCPPKLCDFRPERVRFWLQEMRVAKLSNLDPVLIARDYAAPRGDRHMGRGSRCNPYGSSAELMVIAIQALLPENYSANDVKLLGQDADAVALQLCPFACAKMPANGTTAP